MITIHEKHTTEFNTLGLGALLPGSCVVTEELNGLYELQMSHSYDEWGKWKRIEKGCILYASTPDGKQPFRIYNTRPTMDGITVNARHIFYDLLDNQCEPISFSGTAEEALTAMENAFAYEMPFWFTTDISVSGELKTGRMNPIQVLLTNDEDVTGFVQGFGGELQRDGFHVSVQASIGQDRDVAIRYRKNLIGLEVTEDDSDVKTRVICYGKNGTIETVDSPYIGQYPYPKIRNLENTDKFAAALRPEAEALFDSGIDLPLVNIKVDFVELSKTAEYADYAPLEKVFLGDIVSVINPKMNFEKKARVISYEWDCLLEKYTQVELGDFMPTLATSVTSGVHSGSLAGNAMCSAAAAMAALETHVADKNNPHQTMVEGLPGVTEADNGKVLQVVGGKWIPEVLNVYGEEYTVTPTVEGFTMKTADKMMADDVTVNPIPYYETSNNAGGNTVYIGNEIEVE